MTTAKFLKFPRRYWHLQFTTSARKAGFKKSQLPSYKLTCQSIGSMQDTQHAHLPVKIARAVRPISKSRPTYDALASTFKLNVPMLKMLWQEDSGYKLCLQQFSQWAAKNLAVSPMAADNTEVTIPLSTAVLLFPTGNVSGTQYRTGLWAPIFTSAFKVNGSKCKPAWNQSHMIPGTQTEHSVFSAIVSGSVLVPALMVGFKVVDIGAVNAGDCLLLVAVLKVQTFLSHIPFGVDMLEGMCFYIGNANDGHLSIDEIWLEFDPIEQVVVLHNCPNVMNFDLLSYHSNAQALEVHHPSFLKNNQRFKECIVEVFGSYQSVYKKLIERDIFLI
ncbi:hypothetical protein HDU81_009140 [Chytriomyces hyalinus]|nr:hypothetical protein HDU81_009140 [Chytriomyces hyalinus]